MPPSVFPNATAMQPHIAVNEKDEEMIHVQKEVTLSAYQKLAFPDGYDFSTMPSKVKDHRTVYCLEIDELTSAHAHFGYTVA